MLTPASLFQNFGANVICTDNFSHIYNQCIEITLSHVPSFIRVCHAKDNAARLMKTYSL